MTKLLTLLHPRDAQQHYASGAWQHDTLYALLAHHAATRPDAFALRDGRHRLTWRQLHGRVDTLAAQLHQAGVAPGQRVATWLPSRAEGVVTLLACSRNGY